MRRLAALVLVALLAACGSDPEPKDDPTPTTPATTAPKLTQAQADKQLLAAAANGNTKAAEEAIAAGANLEVRNNRERTPLHVAVWEDQVEVAKVLVAAGANVDALDDLHETPWTATGVTGSVAMLEVILPAEPDLTIENRFGGTALVPACEAGHVAYVKRVIQVGLDVDHVTNQGLTCMLEAVLLGDGGPEHQQIVAHLLAKGANRNIRDPHGLTALDYANKYGYTEIARILRN